MEKTQYPIELSGSTTWNLGRTREAEFRRFILRADGFAFEFDYERSHYSGTFIKTASDVFSGTFSASGDGGPRSGRGCCRLSPTEDGYALEGEWHEKEEGDSVPRSYPEWRAELYIP